MEDDVHDQWKRFLTPEILRSNLLISSLYISAFEVLKNSIIERIHDFYWMGWSSEAGDKFDKKYDSDVLLKNRSTLYASILWLKEEGAIGDDDITIFETIKRYRNNIAHKINDILFNGFPADLPERFSDMVSLLDKIEKWWIINFEIPTNEGLAERQINEDEIIPGSVATIKMMMDIALGSDEVAEYYLKELINNGVIKAP